MSRVDHFFLFFLKKYLLIYLFTERGEGREKGKEKERERNIDQLPLIHSLTKD